MNRDIMETSMGYNGSEFISDMVKHTAIGCVYNALQVINDAVISQISASITGNAITGVVLSAGTIIYGRFSSLTLTSGQVLAYKGM